ncbi:MAG: hypothetical protein V1787_04955 [Candidatus Micrarchaeota archaeon]
MSSQNAPQALEKTVAVSGVMTSGTQAAQPGQVQVAGNGQFLGFVNHYHFNTPNGQHNPGEGHSGAHDKPEGEQQVNSFWGEFEKSEPEKTGWVDEILRKPPFNIGVWGVMADHPKWKRKGNNAGTSRVNLDSLWRLGTRQEIVNHYNNVMKRTYRKLGYSFMGLAIAVYGYLAFSNNGELAFALLAMFGAFLCSRYWTKAWGGYAGEWADYEGDPVRAVVHHAYAHTGGKYMMG